MPSREEIVVQFGADTKQIDAALRSMKGRFNDFSKDIGARIGAVFAVGGLIAGLDKLTGFVDKLRRTAEGLGVGTEFLQDFQAAARNNGSGDEKALKGLEELAKRIGAAREEGGEAAELFDKFGISLENTNGTARTTEEVMRAIADKMAATKDGTLRANIAFQLLGKAGVELIATLQGGSAAIDEFGASADKLSELDIKALDDAKDKIDALGNSALIAGGRILGGLLASLEKLNSGDVSKAEVRNLLDLLQTNPWGLADAAIDIGVDKNSPPLSRDEARQKNTIAARLAAVKLLAQQFAESKKQFDARQKSERDLGAVEETNADKTTRLKKEIADLEEGIRSDKFEGLANDKAMADLAAKRVEFAKAEKTLNADNLKIEQQRAKATADAIHDIQERNGLTISQLAEMPINNGRWIGNRRQKRFQPGFDPFANAKLMAQDAESQREMAQNALAAGDIGWFKQHNLNADAITNDLNAAFPGLLKPSEYEGFKKALTELGWQKFIEAALGGGGIDIKPTMGQ